MTKIRSTLLAILTLGAGATIAQAQSPATPSPARAHRAHARAARRAEGHGARALMRGITLTDAEKARLKTVHEKYREEHKALVASFAPQRDARRAARQRGDTAALTAMRARGAEMREKSEALRAREQSDVRAALTSEHQSVYDRNVADWKQKRDARLAKAKERGGRGRRSR